MIGRARSIWLTLGAVALCAGPAAWEAFGARGRRRRNPWRTLTTGRRVDLDSEGRIAKGGPADWRGVHVADVAPLSRELRQIDRTDCAALVPRPRGARFRRKLDVYDAMEAADARLAVVLDDPARFKHNLDSYAAAVGKPQIADWRAALMDAIPAKGSWDRVWDSPKLRAFRESLEGSYDWPGGRIVPPVEAMRGTEYEAAIEACERDQDTARADVLTRARVGRLQLEEAPF